MPWERQNAGSRGFAEMAGGTDGFDATRIQMSQMPSDGQYVPANRRPANDPSLGRARYGAVAPSALEATAEHPWTPEASNSSGGGRARYGGVSPLALEATAPHASQPQDSHPPAYRPPYRPFNPPGTNAPFAGAESPSPMVHPPERGPYNPTQPPANFPVEQPGQRPNGGIDPATGQPLPSWRPRPDQLVVPPRVPGSETLEHPGGQNHGERPSPYGTITQYVRGRLDDNQMKYSVLHQLEAGAVGGLLGSGPLPYLLDKAAVNVPLAKVWLRSGHSPLQMQLQALGNQQLLYSTQQMKINDDIGTHEKTINEAMARRAEVARTTEQPELDYATGTARVDRLINDAGLKAGRTKKPDVADAWIKRQNFLQEAKANGYEYAQGLDLTNQVQLQKITGPEGAKAPTVERILFPEDVQVLQQMQANHEIQMANGEIAQLNKAAAAIERNHLVVDSSIERITRTGESGFGILGTGKGVTVEVGVTPDGTPITREIAAWKEPVAAESGWSKPLQRVAGKWNGDQWTSKVAEGVMVAGASMATSMALDNVFKGKATNNLGTELPFVLGAMLVPNLSPKQRIAATVGATATGWAIDHFAPVRSDSTISKIMAPNWVDGLATSAAWMLPFNSIEGRIGAVAIGYGFGRVASAVENFTDIHVPGMTKLDHTKTMNDAVTAAVRAGEGGMNNQHFQEIVSKGKELGVESEGLLIGQFSDFANLHRTDRNPLTGFYGSAALQTALGDTWMERGTPITGDINEDAQSLDYRILRGTGLDLSAPLQPKGLGDATTFYRGAANNLVQAEQLAINSHAPQTQIDDIRQSRKYVEDKLDGIYGKHDIPGAYNLLKDEVRKHIADHRIEKYQVALRERVDRAPTNDPRFAAKLCRDMVLLDLSIAGYQSETHNNGGDAAVMYEEAKRYLRVAKQLDANNPNNPQLDAIVQQLGPSIQVSTRNQFNSGLNNPFGVRQ